MLHDLDTTIVQMLKASLPADVTAALTFTFDAPSGAFPPASLPRPAVDLYLYSATPNMDLRDNGSTVQRLPNGAVVKVRPPAHVDCSYLVSVWPTADAQDGMLEEHNVFGAVLRALLGSPVVPLSLMQGALQKTQSDPMAARVEASSAEKLAPLWQSFGKPGKLSLTYTVSVSVPTADPETVVLATDKLLKFRQLEEGAPR